MDFKELPLEDLSTSAVWSALDTDTRKAAAQAIYADKESRREADVAIAATLRFREVAVKKLPLEQRIGYVVKAVRPDDSLAASLLIALHLEDRTPLLEAFLTALEVPQEGGVIDPDHELQEFDEAALVKALEQVDGAFDKSQVDVYLACLLAMDPDPWAALIPILKKR